MNGKKIKIELKINKMFFQTFSKCLFVFAFLLVFTSDKAKAFDQINPQYYQPFPANSPYDQQQQSFAPQPQAGAFAPQPQAGAFGPNNYAEPTGGLDGYPDIGADMPVPPQPQMQDDSAQVDDIVPPAQNQNNEDIVADVEKEATNDAVVDANNEIPIRPSQEQTRPEESDNEIGVQEVQPQPEEDAGEAGQQTGEDAGEGVDSQQPDNDWQTKTDGEAVPEAPCDKPGSEVMPLSKLCSLPPHKGTGNDDIFRYYYNPVVQQCIPFSYSGTGGNANRFVSVKNCYEICHPADPTVKKPRVVSAIKAYLVPNLKADCPKPRSRARSLLNSPREVVIRQMPHPLDSSKTLTIVQNARYVPRPQQYVYDDPRDGRVQILHQYQTQQDNTGSRPDMQQNYIYARK